MSDFVPCSEADFLWNLAYSENDSESRHGDRWRQELGLRLSELLLRGDPSALGEQDWERVRTSFTKVRGEGFLAPLLDLHPQWYRGPVDLTRLRDVRLLNIAPFRAIAPNHLLGEFVDALDRGASTAPDRFSQRYQRLRPKFDLDRVRGVPVLVAERREGPYTEVDGLTRMSILLSRAQKGEAAPQRIDVLLGLTDRLRAWAWY